MFGFGPETFPAAFGPYESEGLAHLYPDFHYESPHNVALDALTSQGVPAEGLALLGKVPRTITQTAQGSTADLIVMRTHARTGAARAVLGSVADVVVRSSSIPVMLVRGANAPVLGHESHQQLSVAQP